MTTIPGYRYDTDLPPSPIDLDELEAATLTVALWAQPYAPETW